MTPQQLKILKQHQLIPTAEHIKMLEGGSFQQTDMDTIVFLARICNVLYRAGLPVISDAQYDEGVIPLIVEQDPQHSFLHQVEPDAFTGKTKPLPQPMLSTQKAYTETAVRSWISSIVKTADELGIRAQSLLFTITPKLDGYACLDDGQTLYTRGDGLSGTDITYILDRGVKVIGARALGPGEIVVDKTYFETYLSGEYENTRNFIGSILREQQLSLIVQEACKAGAVVFQPFSLLPGWTGTLSELLQDYASIIDRVWGLVNFDVDGVVLQVNDPDIRATMGSTRHHHRWQMAFKRNEAPTDVPVIDVLYQTGKTGVITPVALLQPTAISGVTVSRATAHNVGHVKKWSLGPGSIVKVVRAGLVIPKIIEAIKPGHMQIPSVCPSCGSAVGWENDRLYCSNLISCPAQLERKLLYFFDTLANLDGFGPATIEILCQHGIQSVSDIYQCTPQRFQQMGLGLKQSDNLYAALANSRRVPIADWQFLAAFGISNIGKGGCELLLKHYPLLEVFNLTKEQIIGIKGFADKSADTIINTLKTIRAEFDALYALNFTLRITPIGGQKTQLSPISGQLVVFTGTMTTRTRQVMEREAKALGAVVGSSVTGKTNYLIVGSDPGANKLKAAQQHGTTILTESEYQQLLGD